MSQSRNEKVLHILKAADGPLTPSVIASRIAESWCCHGGDFRYPQSAQISPILKRISAKRVEGGWVFDGSEKSIEKCCNCRFYHAEKEAHYGMVQDQPLHPGDYEAPCRRYPPVRGDVDYYGALGGQDVHRDAYAGPTVNSQDWCGEWKAANREVRP
ncbi:hypothetical protein GTP38_11220 [Duganella sp. FT94W]|uniref:Uncharacterized protein n=1 Tax=Duganella lactea TaxID=2692173 RepID=A0ABW9V5E1_9BURK|nr:hypothetical protein [Duganella lactea]MYM34909.1 hypothetical protein [Duganella lactea]